MAQTWPGNLRELQELLLRAATEARDGRIDAALLERLLGPATAAPDPQVMDERAWILDALRRHRFRRGETAAFLGIARKTLYNRMRRLGLET
jgi:transcriptional regulator of acetoin/glycerol metabolism